MKVHFWIDPYAEAGLYGARVHEGRTGLCGSMPETLFTPLPALWVAPEHPCESSAYEAAQAMIEEYIHGLRRAGQKVEHTVSDKPEIVSRF